MNRIFITHLNHNDSLWKRPREDYAEIECDIINKVLDLMERDSDFTYFVEQSLMLHDYIRQYPDRAETLRRRVREGRFEITGGAWTITDLNMVSGESILRNFILGLRFCESAFGVPVQTGCLADAFGQAAQMPQILRSFGMDTVLPGRCVTTDPVADVQRGAPFLWIGPDGSAVLAGVAAEGPFVGCYEPMSSTWIEGETHKAVQKLLRHPAGVLYIGSEELVPRRVVFQKLKEVTKQYPEAEFVYANISDYYKEAKELIAQGTLRPGTHHGEFNPAFTGCYTTRSGVKQKNAALQSALYEAEALEAAVCLGGGAAGPGFGGVWEKTVLNQFHDALCGCCSPCAYKDILERYAAAEEELRCAVEALAGRGEPRFFFNTHMRRSGGIVCLKPGGRVLYGGKELPQVAADGALFVSVPSLGGLCAAAFERAEEAEPETLRPGADRIGNAFYSVAAENTGPSVYSAAAGFGLPGPVGGLVVREDLGGFWSARPTGREEALRPSYCRTEESKLLSRVVCGGRQEGVPWDGELRCKWERELRLWKDTDRADLVYRVNWHGKQSILSAAFKLPFSCDEVFYDAPFHVCARKPYRTDPEDRFFSDKGGEWPSLRFVSVSDGEHGVSVFHRGCHGVLHRENEILVNLLRAPTAPEYGIIRWDDFHAGGVLPDETSLEEGSHTFSLALRLHKGDWKRAGALQTAEEFLSPPMALHCAPASPGVSLETEGCVGVSALKRSDDGRGLVLRLWEAAGEETECTVSLPGCREAHLCTPDEKLLSPLPCRDGKITLRIRPHGFVTVRAVTR